MCVIARFSTRYYSQRAVYLTTAVVWRGGMWVLARFSNRYYTLLAVCLEQYASAGSSTVVFLSFLPGWAGRGGV